MIGHKNSPKLTILGDILYETLKAANPKLPGKSESFVKDLGTIGKYRERYNWRPAEASNAQRLEGVDRHDYHVLGSCVVAVGQSPELQISAPFSGLSASLS